MNVFGSLDYAGITYLRGNVTTTGTQTYNGAVHLTNNDTLTTTNRGVTFDSTVDGTYALTVITGLEATTFDGSVGSMVKVGSVTVTSATINQQSTMNVMGDLSYSGTAFLNGNVTTTGSQTYNGAVHLTNGDTLTTTNSDVTFDSTLDGTTSGAQSLTVRAGTGSTTFDAAVGGSANLGSVSVTSGTITQQSTMNVVGDLSYTGITYLNGNVTTTGNQAYDGAVHLTNSDTLTSTNNGNVTFDSTIDGTTVCQQSLTLNTGTGRTTFGGNVGGVISLESLSVSGPSTLDGNITTCDTQTYSGAVTLGANDTLTSKEGNIFFGSTVDGAYALTVSAESGSVTFTGDRMGSGNNSHFAAIGATIPLTSLDITGVHTLLIGDVTTIGHQTYNDDVQVFNVITLTSERGGNIEFYGSLDGPGGLIVYTTGEAEFHGSVGAHESLMPFKIPGAGAHTIAFDVTPPVKLLHIPDAQVVNDQLHDTIAPPTLVGVVNHDIQVKEEVVTSKLLVNLVFTLADQTEEFELGELDLDGLLDEIAKNKESGKQTFPDGRYKIVVQEPGDANKRTVLEFNIVNGSIDDGIESIRDRLPSSSKRQQQTEPDANSYDGDSASSGISVPDSTDSTTTEPGGSSIDSTTFSQIQAISAFESSTLNEESCQAKTFIEGNSRFGSKRSRIEWNNNNDHNLEHKRSDSAFDYERTLNGSNESVEYISEVVTGEPSMAGSSIMFFGASSLVMSGLGWLKDKSDVDRNPADSPRFDRAARLLRKSDSYRGVSR